MQAAMTDPQNPQDNLISTEKNIPNADCKTIVQSAFGDYCETRTIKNTEHSIPAQHRGARCALGLIRFYQQAISPGLAPHCRFQPTCSAYASEAIRRYGLLKGIWLGIRRLLKCGPWHPGGWDPVP